MLATDLPIQFPSEETIIITFYVTILNPSCLVVLGYNWLTCHNPLIDWVLGSITFRSPEIRQPHLPPTMSIQDVLLQTSTFDEPLGSTLPSGAPCVSMINAATFMHASKLPDAVSFKIFISNTSKSPTPDTPNTSVDLSNVPEEYHNFTDVFSKGKADTLAPH